MDDFKYKPDKIKYKTNVENLDLLHSEFINNIQKEEFKIKNKIKKLKLLKLKLSVHDSKNCETIDYLNERTKLLDEIEKISNLIYNFENREVDYYSKTINILSDYYKINNNSNDLNVNANVNNCFINDVIVNDISNNVIINNISNNDNVNNISINDNDDNDDNDDISDVINNINDDNNVNINNNINDNITLEKLKLLNNIKRNKRKEKKKKITTTNNINNSTNIFDYIGNLNIENSNASSNENKANLFDQYKQLLYYSSNKINNNICEFCKNKLSLKNDGDKICVSCDKLYDNIIDVDNFNYKDSMIIKPIFPYTKKNHFSEWLSLLQARENSNVTDEIIDKVKNEFTKLRLSTEEINLLTYAKIKKIFKKIHLHEYYKNISFIIFKITNKQPPVFTKEQEEKLKKMFDLTQEPFQKFKNKNRKNYLSYPYALYKFCELLELDEFCKYFFLLKNRKKLREQDELFKKICNFLNWEFYPSI